MTIIKACPCFVKLFPGHRSFAQNNCILSALRKNLASKSACEVNDVFVLLRALLATFPGFFGFAETGQAAFHAFWRFVSVLFAFCDLFCCLFSFPSPLSPLTSRYRMQRGKSTKKTPRKNPGCHSFIRTFRRYHIVLRQR